MNRDTYNGALSAIPGKYNDKCQVEIEAMQEFDLTRGDQDNGTENEKTKEQAHPIPYKFFNLPPVARS